MEVGVLVKTGVANSTVTGCVAVETGVLEAQEASKTKIKTINMLRANGFIVASIVSIILPNMHHLTTK
jgi:hypothetical protein